MSQIKANIFGKKLPAWLLLAALVVVGAGAATGLVLKDQINGTTTIAVSQALAVTAVTSGGGDEDEFLATIDDDGMAWAAHFEANNGDTLELEVTVYNYGGSDDIVALLTMDVPDGITVNIEGDDDAGDNVVQVAHHQWKFVVDNTDDNTLDITLAIEEAQATGFYEISSTIVPLNV